MIRIFIGSFVRGCVDAVLSFPLQEFLRDNHLLLEDAFAVLHQSKVTELADSNTASVIASVISSASGMETACRSDASFRKF